MATLKIKGVPIADDFAEAFPMHVTRLLVTGPAKRWVLHAARAATGFATSVIACGCEAGIERSLTRRQTPDGRDGVALLLFAISSKELQRQVQNRVGQCILTCPGSACFAGMQTGKPIPMGQQLRYFGDGWQSSKKPGDVRYWRIPVMDGEFICAAHTYAQQAIGGGNFLLLAPAEDTALAAAEAAVEAIAAVAGTITPFPGGVVRSGSKVGSRYPGLRASTNHAYCPTLRAQVDSRLPRGTGCVLEVVIDGLDEDCIREAMRVGIRAACHAAPQLLGVGAGNYGGKLGPHHFHLHKLFDKGARRS